MFDNTSKATFYIIIRGKFNLYTNIKGCGFICTYLKDVEKWLTTDFMCTVLEVDVLLYMFWLYIFFLHQSLDVECVPQSMIMDFFSALDGRCYLLLAAILSCFTKKQASVHPPSLFSVFLSQYFSRMCTDRQLVQKQAPCPPPQNQRWRNWTLSTLSSYSSTLNVSTDSQAGEQAAFSALNTPLHFHFHLHTYSFALAHGLSYLQEVAVCHIQFFCFLQTKYSMLFLPIHIYSISRMHGIPNTTGKHFRKCLRGAYTWMRVYLSVTLVCFQIAAWRWKMCWGNLTQMAVWPSTDMERWGDNMPCCSPSGPTLHISHNVARQGPTFV